MYSMKYHINIFTHKYVCLSGLVWSGLVWSCLYKTQLDTTIVDMSKPILAGQTQKHRQRWKGGKGNTYKSHRISHAKTMKKKRCWFLILSWVPRLLKVRCCCRCCCSCFCLSPQSLPHELHKYLWGCLRWHMIRLCKLWIWDNWISFGPDPRLAFYWHVSAVHGILTWMQCSPVMDKAAWVPGFREPRPRPRPCPPWVVKNT